MSEYGGRFGDHIEAREARGQGDTNVNGAYVPDCPDCKATERQYQKERRYLNKVAGIATQLMCVAGLNWEKEVAIACNFTGDEAANMRRWDSLHEKAAKKIRELRESLKSLKHGDGCYCEAAFAGPGCHPSHSPECQAARSALGES